MLHSEVINYSRILLLTVFGMGKEGRTWVRKEVRKEGVGGEGEGEGEGADFKLILTTPL